MEQTSKDYFIRKIRSNNRNKINLSKNILHSTLCTYGSIAGGTAIILNNPNSFDFQPYEIAGVICAGTGILLSLGLIALEIRDYNQSQHNNVNLLEKTKVYTKHLQKQINI